MTAEDKKTCFIAMPITTHPHEAERYGGDEDHWVHVMETIFVPAIERAGFKPVRPQAVGSDMIHGHIVRALEKADMVLCDLSGHNPNVFFELGVRTSLDKPVALAKDEHLGFPFDTGVLNTHSYKSSLSGWEVAAEVDLLAQHILASERTCAGRNPMWRHFGLTMAAEKPSSNNTSASDAKLELMFESVQDLRREFALMRVQESSSSATIPETFGRPSAGRMMEISRLGNALENVLLGELRHIGHNQSRPEYTLRYVLLEGADPATSARKPIMEVATSMGYRLVRVEDIDGGAIVVVRPK